jgi:hypothetical protein
MRKVPVEGLIQGLYDRNHTLLKDGTQILIDHMFEFLIRPPKVPLDETCKPAPLPEVPDCSLYPQVFSGLRSKPARIGLAVQAAFEIDTLEIALHQYEGLIDRFFILEGVRKPLLWEAVRNTLGLIGSILGSCLVLNDADTIKARNGAEGIWSVEYYQERQSWREIETWNQFEKFFEGDDVIGFGDIDEIPSRENLQLLKS